MRLSLLLCVVIWSGCTCTLPETVPMKVSLKVELSPNTPSVNPDKSMHERFIGAEVVSNGKVLTTLELRHNVLLEGTYTATRAEAVGSQKAGYALRVKGTCGMQELPLSPPSASFKTPARAFSSIACQERPRRARLSGPGRGHERRALRRCR